MSKVSFYEFNQFLNEQLKEQYPTIEILIREGGDYIWNNVYELVFIEGGKKIRYRPYDLYQKAEELENYEEVIDDFLQLLRKEVKGT